MEVQIRGIHLERMACPVPHTLIWNIEHIEQKFNIKCFIFYLFTIAFISIEPLTWYVQYMYRAIGKLKNPEPQFRNRKYSISMDWISLSLSFHVPIFIHSLIVLKSKKDYYFELIFIVIIVH